MALSLGTYFGTLFQVIAQDLAKKDQLLFRIGVWVSHHSGSQGA
jgi:hypothetical protein